MLTKVNLSLILVLLTCSCKKEPEAPLPVANYYVDNAGCSSPCYVKFYDQSYSAMSWHWDFDNGITSTYENDSTVYNTAGFYNVTLTIWNADNVEDKLTKQVTVW